MKNSGWFIEFLVTFIITLITAVVVTLVWNLLAHGAANVDWATSFRLAVILGVVMPVVNRAGKKD